MKNLEQIAKELIQAIGEDPTREGLKETPKRFAKAYEKLFSGYTDDLEPKLTTFDGENYDEMIICRDIDFYSTCEHHMLPFFGTVTIGYIPKKKIIGLSKLPRIVEHFSRRLQNQERLTQQIAKTLEKHLDPDGVGVIIKAKHLCMMARGVQKQNASMTTSYCTGSFRKEPSTRSEFLILAQ